jgi:8-oxo-dGTP pyrophosphatase MutT (NUDIX family)
MNISIEELKKRLTGELPGEEAHVPMSPIGRGKSSEALKKASQVRESAVAIVLFQEQELFSSVLIQRPTYKGVHSGQVCLPGGKREDFENHLYETAIRECVEETGLDETHLNLLGALTPVYIPVSNHHVHPYIFHYPITPSYTPDPREVVEIIPFQIGNLLDDTKMKRKDIIVREDHTLKKVPYFDIENRIVWGATAIILHEFREILLR